ncbi:FG-GAP-like repeat-containing protein [Tautonia sociabilis]|uniref:ASPIC/UnbV domain-containing protein n=1 Tax=Tautonia sociabilis TaxID=2080755 RepID=A0A432MFN1_9BACT|nr:FG-GAP-like repeat-containing protein [Tautonia sociabilis]RUL84906.1 hypothetical protein TsocGM_19740 [Tautonia sociabilis]
MTRRTTADDQTPSRWRGLGRAIARLVLAALPLVAAGWGWQEWRFRTGLAAARAEYSAGAIDSARDRLSRLADHRPRHGETLYLLGLCEQAMGRPAAARDAWARVPEHSPSFGEAATRQASIAIAAGRYQEAEDRALAALRVPGPHEEMARTVFALLLYLEGRLDEYRDWLLDGLDAEPDPTRNLVELWQLDAAPYPLETTRAALVKASRASPNDPRVLLARANLAIRSGAHDEAARLLDACDRLLPDDPATARSRLSLAIATDDLDGARAALRRLGPGGLSRSRALAVRAWFASKRGDPDAERAVLERWIELEPSNQSALERLIGLAVATGQLDRAAELRRRKSELDLAFETYRGLIGRGTSPGRAAELARTAEALGRRQEAAAWWRLHQSYAPDDPEPARALARLGAEIAAVETETAAFDLSDLAPGAAPLAPETSLPSFLPSFADEAGRAGLRFSYDSGKSPNRQMPETMGGGVGLLDCDGDGLLDVYLVQGGPFPPDSARPNDGDRLFRNLGDASFEDVTGPSGLAGLSRGYGHGVAVGDIDNDGDPDLFLTRWRSYALFLNDGDGTFSDATDAFGLGGDRGWPTSAAFADLDLDGDLDLYVCHYVAWDPERPRPCAHPETFEPVYCAPLVVPAEADRLYRNDGDRFVDVTEEAGIVDRDGRGLGVVAADVDGDTLVDLYVANDATANFLFRNLGGLRFEEVGMPAGLAANASGGFEGSMGIAFGDLDGDALPELAVTNLYGESTTLYRNLGRGIFVDQTEPSGLGIASRFLLGFGMGFLDFDNDGFLDLAVANGHVNDYRPDFPYAMPAQLLAGDGRRLVDVTEQAGPSFTTPRVGRALALGDLDNDGRVDGVLVPLDSPVALLRNRTAGGRFVTFRLEGTESNRDGVGARVTLEAGGRRQVSWRQGGGSYQSAHDGRLHFGLGTADRIDSVEIRWPSGRVDRLEDLDADTGYLIREGAPAPSPLPGFPGPP